MTMTTVTLTEVAKRLHVIAERLDNLGALPNVSARLQLQVGEGYYDNPLTRDVRITTVDAIAAEFAVDADNGPLCTGSNVWVRAAVTCDPTGNADDAVELRVRTDVPPPAERCACGAVCTHALEPS